MSRNRGNWRETTPAHQPGIAVPPHRTSEPVRIGISLGNLTIRMIIAGFLIGFGVRGLILLVLPL